MNNFHLPLPEELHGELRLLAARMKRPATEIAREGIAHWLQMLRRKARRMDIQNFAQEMAGTELDLDDELEATSLEIFVEE